MIQTKRRPVKKNAWTGGQLFCSIALYACTLLLAGCSGGTRAADDPEVTPVSGRVSYRGKPLEDAFIRLYPMTKPSDGQTLVLPRARSAADGSFRVSTYRTADGAPAGKYQVAVSWSGPLKGLTEDQQDNLPEKLPRKFTKPMTSGIVVEIGDSETTLPLIELE